MNTSTNKTLFVMTSMLLAGSAFADRVQSVPVDQRFVSNVTEAQIDTITDQGFRLHDIEVVNSSPLRFAGSFVRNTGTYQKAWWWTANKTLAEFEQFIADRGARPIDIELTVVNGQRRFAGTFIKNIGADAVQWQVFDNVTWAGLQQAVNTFGGRPIDLDFRVVNGERRFTGVMIKNSGNFFRNFTYFSSRSAAQIQQLISQTNYQLTDIERIGPDAYAGILQSNPGKLWWGRFGRTWAQMNQDQDQFGSRVIDMERYEVNGQSRFDYILINNSNALETRVGQLLRNGTDGVRGFYVRQLNGPRLGQLMADYRYYPASSIKMLEHMYWSYRVDQFGLSQFTPVRIYTNHTNDVHPNTDTFFNQSLVLTQQNMMFASSNSNANALQDAAGGNNGVTGRNNIMNFAANVLGLDDDIQLNHKFAAGGINNDPYNVATGREYGLMMEKAVDGSVFSPAGFAYLRANMLNETNNSGFRAGLRAVVLQEGAAASKTNAEINNYWSLVRVLWKGGNNGSTNISSVGYAQLPIKGRNGRIGSREYVLSAFVEGASNNTFGGGGASNVILPELLREVVRESIANW